MAIPTIETPRLVLHAHGLCDFDDCAALWADPAATRHIGGKPSSPEETWQRLLRYRGHWDLLGFGYWVVADRETGRFLGDAGLATNRRVVEPALPNWPEAGWVLRPDAWGQGIASEALAAILDWSDRELPAPGTTAIFHPDNAASLRVAEKARFGAWRRCNYRGVDIVAATRSTPARLH